MSLCKDILEKGHTLCIDNWYIGINLAEKMLIKKCYTNISLIGTLRQNYRGIPQEIKFRKQKRSELIARENKNDITILKWKDKLDVLIFSTKHLTEWNDIGE